MEKYDRELKVLTSNKLRAAWVPVLVGITSASLEDGTLLQRDRGEEGIRRHKDTSPTHMVNVIPSSPNTSSEGTEFDVKSMQGWFNWRLIAWSHNLFDKNGHELDHTLTVGPTSTLTVGPTSTLTVGPTSTLTVGPTNTLTVGPTSTLTVGPTSTLTVGPTSTLTVGPTSTLTVGPTSQHADSGPHQHADGGPLATER
ncbi:hypothetical protein FHG87_020719 [Trinorchestia longiramus]|nr:hypothetical protein FHG87_020719 [Trinorchestia longiramus]